MINRSARSSCEGEEDEAAEKPNRSQPAHVSRISAVATIPSESLRYEPISSPALVLIGRCEDPWEWAAASVRQHDQTVVSRRRNGMGPQEFWHRFYAADHIVTSTSLNGSQTSAAGMDKEWRSSRRDSMR